MNILWFEKKANLTKGVTYVAPCILVNERVFAERRFMERLGDVLRGKEIGKSLQR